MSVDEKSTFYFRNRAVIEEWAALRSVARDSLSAELAPLADRVEAAVPSRAQLHIRPGDYPNVGFTKPTWLATGVTLSVVVGWTPKNLLVPTADNPWPYVGIYLPHGQQRYEAAFEAIRLRCMDLARDLGWHKTERGYPFWTDAPVPPELAELNGFAQSLVDRLVQGWSALEARLDTVIAQLGP